MPRCTHRTAFALVWLVLRQLLARLLTASVRVPHYEAAARAEAAKFRGVSYHKRGHVFVAKLCAGGRPPYIGCFQSAQKAAEAYDQEVRCLYPDATPDHQFRRKNWLNFPSDEEAAYDESPEQARKRAINIYGANHRKEARSFELLKEALDASVYSEKYELVRLTGSSKADALLKLRGSSQAGLPIQIKAATSQWKQGKVYRFYGLLGYDGMLVVFVALDGAHFWAAAGEELKSNHLRITIGCESDTERRVESIGVLFVACFKNIKKFPHMSVEEAESQCSPSNRVEVAAHRQLRNLFRCLNWSLTCPRQHLSTVDSVLEVRIGRPLVHLQEKASHLSGGRYKVQMSKCGGSLGRLAYAEDDFDLLAACVVQQEQLQGVFLLPTSELVQKGLVSKRPCSLPLYPPWSAPKRNSTKEKYAWQLDFFLDLRTWQGSSELPPQVKRRLERVISQVVKGIATTPVPKPR